MKHSVRVAITIRSFDLQGSAFKNLQDHFTISFTNTSGKRLSESELIADISDCEAVIAGTEKFSRAVIDKCRALRIISRVGVGTDSIDLNAARIRGIHVATTPNSPVQAVAEHTLALLLAAMKNIPQYNEQMRKHINSLMKGSLLAGKKVGIVGLGRVGSRVAEMLEVLGCQISFFDPMVSRELPSSWKRFTSVAELIQNTDILSIHSAPQPDGKPLISDNELSVANGIIIINTARGNLVDEQSLIRALSSGSVKSAALDVFSVEPYTGNLLEFPQVVVTPHVASNTEESRSQMENEAVDNLIHYFREVNS
jgi:D-3-phosphoglycerate dehydrogenase